MNLQNRTIYIKDNLDILRGVDSKCIDLIYLDPPFNTKKTWHAPIGTTAEGASFKDKYTRQDIKEEWLETIKENNDELYSFLHGIKGIGPKGQGDEDYNFCYLSYMAIRLIQCHRILKDTGSIYLHCDPTMSHYLKIVMDCVFGEKNFRNEIVWGYHGPGSPKMRQFNRKHDIILWYSVGKKWIFNAKAVRIPYKDPKQTPRRAFDTGDSFTKENIERMREKGKIPETWWVPQYHTIIQDGRTKEVSNGLRVAVRSKSERLGYPTQKPLKLLERIIKASSNEGDVVLDPFCGCATTCVAAERLNRQWVGIDISIKAYELVKKRLTDEVNFGNVIFKNINEIHCLLSPPKRTDLEKDYREKKFVYVISNPAFPKMFKVGIAKDWKARLKSYQIGDPLRGYKKEFVLETPLFRETEKHIHEQFDNLLEWVQGDLQEIIQAIKDFNK